MNLNNFSEKLRITVDAAFNYAKENSFNYFLPIHILIILLQDDNLISKTLKELKVNKKALLDESIKVSNEQGNNSKETQIQSNVILLLNPFLLIKNITEPQMRIKNNPESNKSTFRIPISSGEISSH